jgi:hypothetical protein
MPARKLDRSSSMSEVRREIAWSQAACDGDPIARPQALRFSQLLEEWQPTFFSTVQYEDGLLRAEQAVARIDDRFDDHINDFHLAVLTVTGEDRSLPHYTLYFNAPPSRIKRYVLGPKLETVRAWLPILEREEDPRLKPFHAKFTEDVAAADAALETRTAAEKTLRHSREVGEVAQFYDRVEQVRDDVYAFLDQHRAQHPELGLPRNFASRFFLKAPPRKLTEEQRQARAEARTRERAERAAKLAMQRAAQEKFRQARRELAAFKR